jgi:7-cyano-7-deazaguanine reductase
VTSSVDQSPLGKSVAYASRYSPAALFAIARAPQRAALGLSPALPFSGADLWTAYEISWLDARGKPEVAVASFRVAAESPNIVESKSVKLYLNSFSETRFDTPAEIERVMSEDLGRAFGNPVTVALVRPPEFARLRASALQGESIDAITVDIEEYSLAPYWLSAGHTSVEETLVSDLFKSNCPITGQPDWASVQIRYCGPRIDRTGLLRYIVSFRRHSGFHEHCVERMFVDIVERCRPERLSVYARFTRRGGLDINPFRSNWESPPAENVRTGRQ